jgi:hypothetical protein
MLKKVNKSVTFELRSQINGRVTLRDIRGDRKVVCTEGAASANALWQKQGFSVAAERTGKLVITEQAGRWEAVGPKRW